MNYNKRYHRQPQSWIRWPTHKVIPSKDAERSTNGTIHFKFEASCRILVALIFLSFHQLCKISLGIILLRAFPILNNDHNLHAYMYMEWFSVLKIMVRKYSFWVILVLYLHFMVPFTYQIITYLQHSFVSICSTCIHFFNNRLEILPNHDPKFSKNWNLSSENLPLWFLIQVRNNQVSSTMKTGQSVDHCN